MFIYHDPAGVILYTIHCSADLAPAGVKIEVPDDTLVDPILAYRVEAGAVVAYDLEPIRGQAIAYVTAHRNRIRQKFITPITGQEMIYIEKEKEAAGFMAVSPEPTDLTPYPFTAAEIGITATTAYGVAQVYLNLAAYWRVVGPQLEGLCLGSVVGLEQATTQAEVNATLAFFDQNIGAFG